MHGTQQRVVGGDRRRFAAREEGLDAFQMAGDFGLQDVEQQGVDTEARQHATVGFLDLCDRFLGRFDGRLGFFLGCHFLDRRCFHRNLGRLGNRSRWRVPGLLAFGETIGHGLDRLQVGAHAAFATQRRQHLGQHVVGVLDQRLHRLAGLDGLVEHAVEHVLDLPAELAQGERANQPATALQGVEHAADRLQQVEVLRLLLPGWQELFKVVDLLLDFLDEHLADLIIDIVGGPFKSTMSRRRCCGCRRADGRGRRSNGDFGRCGGFRRGRRGRSFGLRLSRCGWRSGFAGLWRGGGGRCRHFDRSRLRRFNGRRSFRRSRLQVGRQVRNRPVTQRFQAVTGRLQHGVALRPVLAQRFDEVFEAGQHIGQSVHLLAIRHTLAAQQFDFGEAANGGQVLRRLVQLHDAECASHFFQQARYVGQLRVIPAGFDEGDEALLHLGKVGLCFLDHGVEDLLALRHRQRAPVTGRGRLFATHALHLVVQRCLDVEQRAGHVQQGGFGRFAAAIEHVADRVVLVLDDATRNPQTEHAQRVTDAVEHLDLWLQRGDIGIRIAQVQIERVLDAHQVVLDRRRNGVQQGTVVSGQHTLCVRQLFLAGQQRVEAEHLAQLADATMLGGCMCHEIQQVAGQVTRRIHAEAGLTGVSEALDLALDLADGLLELLARLESLGAQRFHDASRHPEQAAGLFLVGVRDQLIADIADLGDVGVDVLALEPVEQRQLELASLLLGELADLQVRHWQIRPLGRFRQRTGEIRREQHAFRQALLATRCTQFVEQWQQDDGNVLVPGLQALQVIRQLHDAAHEHRIGLVTLLDLAFQQRGRQALHFLGDHGRAI